MNKPHLPSRHRHLETGTVGHRTGATPARTVALRNTIEANAFAGAHRLQEN